MHVNFIQSYCPSEPCVVLPAALYFIAYTGNTAQSTQWSTRWSTQESPRYTPLTELISFIYIVSRETKGDVFRKKKAFSIYATSNNPRSREGERECMYCIYLVMASCQKFLGKTFGSSHTLKDLCAV